MRRTASHERWYQCQDKSIRSDAILNRLADAADRNVDGLGRERYEDVHEWTGVPWWAIWILHRMECNQNFNKHLANGDPIGEATVREPKGIPGGDWGKAASKALERHRASFPDDWYAFGQVCYFFEAWNGWGYFLNHPEVPSPYLWAGTAAERPGKYVADDEWDGEARSRQIGCVALLSGLQFRGRLRRKIKDRYSPSEPALIEESNNGFRVVRFQQFCNEMVGPYPSLKVDGDYGPKTRFRKEELFG